MIRQLVNVQQHYTLLIGSSRLRSHTSHAIGMQSPAPVYQTIFRTTIWVPAMQIYLTNLYALEASRYIKF